jgi:hypothetical protein
MHKSVALLAQRRVEMQKNNNNLEKHLRITTRCLAARSTVTYLAVRFGAADTTAFRPGDASKMHATRNVMRATRKP